LPLLVHHQRRGLALGEAVGGRRHRIGDQSVAILDQQMAKPDGDSA
jgi:hypothetical protein